MGIPFKKYAWGDLNPISRPNSADRMNTVTSNWLKSANLLHEKHYESDVFQNTGPYLGYVLRIETHARDPNSFVRTAGEHGDQGQRVQIKVRIPEIHAPIPAPQDSEDHFVIEMHPTFTATDNNVFEPKIGELVWVDFQNKQTWEGPIFLGSVIQPPLSALMNNNLANSARKAGEVCIDGCLQPAKTKSSAIDVSSFPIAKGSLIPTKENDRCLIFGDSQIKLNLGKTMQAYLKSSGWKTERVGRSGSKVEHWLAKDVCKKNKFELWGCIKNSLKKNKPGLIFISLGGNNKGEATSRAGSDIVQLVKKIRQECGWTSGTTSGKIIIAACPPVIPGGSASGDAHQSKNPGAFSYRSTVNTEMRSRLSSLWGFGNTLYYIDPIKNSKKFLPKYMARKTKGDGVHLDPDGAREYVTNIAVRFGATAKAVKPAPGVEKEESAASSEEEGSKATAKEKEDNRKDLVDGFKAVWKKIGKKINKASRSHIINSISSWQKRRSEIQEKIKAAGTEVPKALKDELALVQKNIDEGQKKLEGWPKPPPCRPCRPYSHRPLKKLVEQAIKRPDNGPAVGLMNTTAGLKGPVLQIEDIKHLSFMAAKCSDGRSAAKFTKVAKQQKDLCDKAGISFHTWGWVYATDYKKAAAEGVIAAKAALALGSKCHWVNAEKHWCGVEGEPYVEDPAGRLAEFIRAFRSTAPGIPLANCCMTYRTQPALKPVQGQINKMFDIFSPMQYSSGKAGGGDTQTNKWKVNWALAEQAGVAYAPTLGTGRQDPKTGEVWGNFAALLETQSTHGADWICFFNGVPSSAKMLNQGNHVNTSIIDLIKELRK